MFNVFGLGKVLEFQHHSRNEEPNLNLKQILNRSRTVHFSTEPPILVRCCYVPFFFTNHNKMTEEQIKELGWKLVKQYNYDQYNTNRYKLGCIEIEFTYEGKELLTHDVTISELNCMPISFNQAKLLTELLGNWAE